MHHLVQPILSSKPEPGHDPNKVLTFDEFIDLLKIEERYFESDILNTKLMITRLRKIFYDKWGWNTQLIKKAAFVQGRYKVTIGDCPELAEGFVGVSQVKRYRDNNYEPKCRIVSYRSNDRVYGNRRAGEIPEIYKDDHQDIYLPEDHHCDIGHTLAGLDALNHFQDVSPIPRWLFFLRPFFPCVDSNADVTTWLGDIATSSTAFVFHFLRCNQPPDSKQEQEYINMNASASDMLGNIDAFVIHSFYDTKTNNGRAVSDIFEDYYRRDGNSTTFRHRRFSEFCKIVDLKDWDGSNFSNEEDWLNYYTDQLRNTAAFMAFSTTTGFQKLTLPHQIWKKKYEHIVKARQLLEVFLKELKQLLQIPNHRL